MSNDTAKSEAQSRDCKNSGAASCSLGFNYVDIVATGCDGWLNLFSDDECIALIRNVKMATNIKKITNERER